MDAPDSRRDPAAGGPGWAADQLALRRLAALYARGADRGEPETYAGVFLPDARLRVFRLPDRNTPTTDLSGHEALSRVPGRLARRYARTFHFVGQCTYDLVGSDEVAGEVYCLAHHLSAATAAGNGERAETGERRESLAATSHVMHMRYLDTYRRDGTGAWKIAERTAYVEWTETRPAEP